MFLNELYCLVSYLCYDSFMTVTLSLFAGAGAQLFDNNGDPLSGGFIYTYLAGTTTPATTYTTISGGTPNSNPIELDSSGRVGNEIWLTNNVGYKFVIKTSNGDIIETIDNVGGAVSSFQLSSSSGSSLIGFIQNGVGAIARTVQSKLRDFVTPFDFGAVGDGLTDDSVAIQACVNDGRAIYFLNSTYLCNSAITLSTSSNINWFGNQATIKYSGSQLEYFIKITQTSPINVNIDGVNIDGGSSVNKVFECRNSINNSTGESTVSLRNMTVQKAKRMNLYSGGSGVYIRGGHSVVLLSNVTIKDCVLPPGQGTSGVIGIAGLTVVADSVTSWCKRLNLTNVNVTKVYSSDLSYQDDQDGLQYFVPDGTDIKKESVLFATGCVFINCYGRSIKTQCRDTYVNQSKFVRTEGLSSFYGNTEIDAQTGSLVIGDSDFEYNNGYQPQIVTNASSDVAYGKPSIVWKDSRVYMDSSTTLKIGMQNYPREGFFTNCKMDHVQFYGKVERPIDFLCNGSSNYLEVNGCYADSIQNGPTSEKAFTYVRASGSTSPYFAYVTMTNNVYVGADTPSLVRDNVSGTATKCSLSAYGNFGFAEDELTSTTTGGLKNNYVARLGKIASYSTEESKGYLKILSKYVAGGTTVVFNVENSRNAIILMQVADDINAFAIFCSSTSGNTVVYKGATLNVGNTSDPGSGFFRVWSAGYQILNVKNTTGSTYNVTMTILSAGVP